MEVVTGRSKCGQVLPFKQEERPDPSRTCSGRSNLTNVRHTIIIKFSVSPF